MRLTVSPLPKHELATGEELEDVAPRLEILALERLPSPDDVARPLVGLARNPLHGEFAGPTDAREVGGIAFVVLALHA